MQRKPWGLLLLLCLTGLTLASTASSVYNCNNFPCLPGVEVLGMGWDAVHGQTRSLQVVEYTYTQVQKYYNPCNDSAAYLVPDQITVSTHIELNMQSQTSVTYSASQQAKLTTAQISLGGGVNWTQGAMSASGGVLFASQYLSDRTDYASFAETSLVKTLYSASLTEPQSLQFTSHFLQAVNRLPTQYNRDIYQQFIALYGTHYLQSSYFGGSGVMQVAVNAQGSQSKSSHEIEAQAGLQFEWLRGGASAGFKDSWFQSSGSQASHWTTTLIGGDPMIMRNLTMWNSWVKTFFNFPAAIATAPEQYPYTVVPLYSIINDTTVRANMQKAVQSYLLDHHYTPDPPCMQQVYCPSQQCCAQNTPYCCANGQCAATRGECGYSLVIQENQGFTCGGTRCASYEPTWSLDCPLTWDRDTLGCDNYGNCQLYSSSHQCSFTVGQQYGCSIQYGPCQVYGSAAYTSTN